MAWPRSLAVAARSRSRLAFSLACGHNLANPIPPRNGRPAMAKKPAAKPTTPTYPVNPALEAAVIAHAEEDTPRLVYADWLDENGDPDRAAFIRNQVALWDKNPADEDYVELVENQVQLDRFYVSSRLKPRVPSAVGFFNSPARVDDGAFHRGFPLFAGEPYPNEGELLDRGYAKRFRDAVPELFQTTTLRGFNFSGWFSHHLDVILDTPEVSKLVALSADNGETESNPPIPIVKSILDSAAAASLRWLDLGYLMPADVERLSKPSCQLRLRKFVGHVAHCSASDVKRLFSSEAFCGLHSLDTCLPAQNTAGAMQALARLPELHTLKAYRFGVGEVNAIPSAGRFASLARLVLHGAPLRDEGAQSLSKANMPRLSVLELAGCKLRNQDFVTLARSPLFAALRSLLISDQVGDQAVAALMESDCAPKLRRLELQGCTITKRSLRRLATAFPNLLTLEVGRSKEPVAPEALSRFFAELNQPLRHLLIQYPITDQAAGSLAGNPALSQLRTLDLGDAEGDFTAKGLTALLTSPHLSNLITLHARGEKLEKAASLLSDPACLPRLRELRVGVSAKVGETIERARPGLTSADPRNPL